MASICPRCNFAHDGFCEEAARRRQEFQQEIDHHKLHCDCTDPAGHVMTQRRERQRRNPKDTIVGARA